MSHDQGTCIYSLLHGPLSGGGGGGGGGGGAVHFHEHCYKLVLGTRNGSDQGCGRTRTVATA